MNASGAGQISQVAYVVEDLDLAIAHWVKLGVGPFFVGRHMKYARRVHRGESTDYDISAAFAFSGDLQIELIEQHNAAPSAMQDFIRSRGYGVQHLGVLVDDIAAGAERLAAQGFPQLSQSVSEVGVETRFFDIGLDGGCVLELIQKNQMLETAFAQMKEASRVWSRGDPYLHEF